MVRFSANGDILIMPHEAGQDAQISLSSLS